MKHSELDIKELATLTQEFGFNEKILKKYLLEDEQQLETLESFKNFFLLPLASERILVVGAGRGGLSVALSQAGFVVDNVEYFAGYVRVINWKYQRLGLSGETHHLPIEKFVTSLQYKFATLVEVIEHVQDPRLALESVYKALAPNGKCFITVPNRFHLYDPHYKLPLICFMPLKWADFLLWLMGKRKNGKRAGQQSLSEMHYYTYGGFKKIAQKIGFKVVDMRWLEITQPDKYLTRKNSRYEKLVRGFQRFGLSRVLAVIFRLFFGHRIILQKPNDCIKERTN